MTSDDPSLPLLSIGLEQTRTLLSRVRDDQLDLPTSCDAWTLSDLVDHVVNVPRVFVTFVQGEEPDWASEPEHVGSDRADRFQAAAQDLVDAWRAAPAGGQRSPLDWQLAELAVHTWDLATAVGEPTSGLDPDVAERGLAFMQANLGDNRGAAFGPERPAPAGADPYTRIAAFAGRDV